MRAVRVLGMCLVGTEAELVTVEARFEARERTRLEVSISGLPDPVIRESRWRLLAALDEHRLHLPQGRLFVNLFPAGMRKAGEALDLPLALGAAAAVGHLTPGALARTLSGSMNARDELRAALAVARRTRELLDRRRRQLEPEVDAIEQRARDAAPVAEHLARRTAAGDQRMAAVAARARVHRAHELEARGQLETSTRARDHDAAGLERLAQRLQRLAPELRQLVEEQEARVRERDLARDRR